MHLPRPQISQLYLDLVRRTHPLSPPILILTSLTVDSLCATRILTALLKRDYVQHKVQPVAGYSELSIVGQQLVLPLTRQRGGEGGVVICIGLGAPVDLDEVLGLDGQSEGAEEDMSSHGVEVWVIDSRRPWNLQNVYGTATVRGEDGNLSLVAGVDQGKLMPTYRANSGGIVVWDDGDIEDQLVKERDAFLALQSMPEISEDDVLAASTEHPESGDHEAEDEIPSSSQPDPDREESRPRKRKSVSPSSDDEEEDDLGSGSDEDERPRQRRRGNSDASIPSSPPKHISQRQLRKRLLKERRKHESTLEAYFSLGTSYGEPVSSMLYSLASELGREDNDLLWLAIVGISSLDLSPLSTNSSGHSASGNKMASERSEQIREVLRDEVRRLNHPDSDLRRHQSISEDVIPTNARSPTDTAIRLSPEPKFLLIRYWSLYDSMMHSPFLSTRLHIWSDAGRKRLHKLLAKMGVSLQEASKGYVHMDMELKQSLRQRIMKFSEQYNLDGLVPDDDGRRGKQGWGFVRSWGWKATMSAVDAAVVVSAILEIGTEHSGKTFDPRWEGSQRGSHASYSSRVRALPTPPHSEDGSQIDPSGHANDAPDWTTNRFFAAYDALNPITTSSTQGLSVLLAQIPTAQYLHRAILRTGSALIHKKQIRHLRAFRMGVVKEGPDVPLFTHPGALTKLAGWVSEAVQVLEAEKGRSRASLAADALVLGCLDETRGVYMVVGLGGGGAGKGRVRSKAEIKEREDRKKRKVAAKAAAKAERARKKQAGREHRREIMEAAGVFVESDEEEESDATESSGSEDSDSESDDDEEFSQARKRRGYGLNKFGRAFQEVVEETAARVRIDSFEHSVIEVKKEDLAGFLEALSLKNVIG